MRLTVLAAAGALASASATGGVLAADYGYMPGPGPAPFVPTWQGFYIGGHAGFGEADVEGAGSAVYIDNATPALNFSGDFRDTLTPGGFIGGAQAGYNWQFNALVFGIEGDISFADWNAYSVLFDEPLDAFGVAADAVGEVSAKVDMLASVRGRLGMAFDNVLVYGTGGVAWAEAEARGTVFVDDGVTINEIDSAKKSFDDMGFVAGGGLSWMILPQTFSVGIEGLYYFFDDKKTFVDDKFDINTGVAVGEATVNASATLDDAWVIRARGDFHF